MEISGDSVKQKNIVFRMCVIVFSGIMIFAVLVSWRSQLLFSAEYVEFPVTKISRKTPNLQAKTLQTELETEKNIDNTK